MKKKKKKLKEKKLSSELNNNKVFRERLKSKIRWFEDNSNSVLAIFTVFLTILTFLLFYFSLYSIAMVEYRTQLNITDVSKMNILNLVSSGRLDVALRSYRDASLKTLRRKPISWNFITWFFYNKKTPNKEYLWILIKSELERHAKDYPVQMIDLSYADMKGVKLQNINFSFVNFYKADLRESDLRGCDFSSTFLYKTDIRNAIIETLNKNDNPLIGFRIYENFDYYGYKDEFENLLSYLKINNQEYQKFLLDSAQIIADDSQIDYWCKLLQSDDWEIRNNALCAISHLSSGQKKEKARSLLKELLNKELSIERNGELFITKNIVKRKEEHQEKTVIPSKEYYENLLTAVAELRDSVILSKIVWYITDPTVTDKRISDLFYFLGYDAIPHLINILDIGTPRLKLESAKILRRLLADEVKRESPDSLILKKIIGSYKNALLGNKHPVDTILEREEVKKEYSVFYPGKIPLLGGKWFKSRANTKKDIRVELLKSLREIKSTKDKEIIKIIKDIAANDLYYNKNNDDYLVRRSAQKTLNKLGIKEK